MTQTSYVNPNGLPADGQITSARDHGDSRARGDTANCRNTNCIGASRRSSSASACMRNYNTLIDRYPGADGMKTGFICASGFNLVASATRNGKRLIAVVLGAPSGAVRAVKAAQLLERGFRAAASPGSRPRSAVSMPSCRSRPTRRTCAKTCAARNASVRQPRRRTTFRRTPAAQVDNASPHASARRTCAGQYSKPSTAARRADAVDGPDRGVHRRRDRPRERRSPPVRRAKPRRKRSRPRRSAPRRREAHRPRPFRGDSRDALKPRQAIAPAPAAKPAAEASRCSGAEAPKPTAAASDGRSPPRKPRQEAAPRPSRNQRRSRTPPPSSAQKPASEADRAVSERRASAAPARPPIPLTLLTGFLGAGKTTLLNRLLRRSGARDTAVIINEFGEVAPRPPPGRAIDDGMLVLSSGCLCCTMRGDLVTRWRSCYAASTTAACRSGAW